MTPEQQKQYSVVARRIGLIQSDINRLKNNETGKEGGFYEESDQVRALRLELGRLVSQLGHMTVSAQRYSDLSNALFHFEDAIDAWKAFRFPRNDEYKVKAANLIILLQELISEGIPDIGTETDLPPCFVGLAKSP